jgi:hypothetical protein
MTASVWQLMPSTWQCVNNPGPNLNRFPNLRDERPLRLRAASVGIREEF